MRVFFAVPILLTAVALQVAATPHLVSGWLSIDLVLLLVVAWGIIKGIEEGLLWGLIGGLALDAVTAAPFGLNTLLLGGIGLLSGLGVSAAVRTVAFGPALMAALATLVYYGVSMAVLAIFGREWRWFGTFRETVLPAAALNGAVMIAIYWLLFQIHRRTEPKIKW